MGSEAKTGGGTKNGSAGGGVGGGGFRGKLNHYLYSGEKKHVFGGILIISAIFGVPWYFMTRGTKQQSHQDYMEKADRARKERLSGTSSTSSAAKIPTAAA